MTSGTDPKALADCPCCGGDAEMDTQQSYRNISTGRLETGIAVYCRDCGLQAMLCRGDIPDLAPEHVIEIWNRRPAADELEKPTPPRGEINAEMLGAAHHDRHPWCQPGDEPNRAWILRFADQDRREMVWTDEYAEQDARAAWAKHSPTWNCYLFATVSAAPPPPEVGVEAVARIIDPFASWNGVGWKHNFDTREEAEQEARKSQNSALTKAREILALIQRGGRDGSE